MLNEPTEIFEISAESDPKLWAILQRPEDRQLLNQAIAEINRISAAAIQPISETEAAYPFDLDSIAEMFESAVVQDESRATA